MRSEVEVRGAGQLPRRVLEDLDDFQFAVLGTSSTYAILGASTVTNTGTSVINGDLGLYPGTSVTGLLPTDVIGDIRKADAVLPAVNDNCADCDGKTVTTTVVVTVRTTVAG